MSNVVSLVFDGQMHCTATHGPTKTVLPIDVPPANGGTGQGLGPFDLLGFGVGS